MRCSININPDKLTFLRGLTRDVVQEARILPGEELSSLAQPPTRKNTTGITLIRPGGRSCYPAFWIRDFAMSLESGFIAPQELKGMLLLTARCQQGEEPVYLETGAVIPPFAIPDHILLNGEPVFFPGTWSSGPDQGGEQFGFQPPFDDNYYFIEMAFHYFQKTGDRSIFSREINGFILLERLERAFAVPPCEENTGIVVTSEKDRGVNFGFFDAVYQTGHLLFASLLRFKAALNLGYIFERLGETRKAREYRKEADSIKKNIPAIFATSSGWLNATTGICKQHDVWGTAYAVYIGVLEGEVKKRALYAIRDAYRAGSLSCRGNIRHILTTENFSENSAWEKALPKINTYQNGAY
ncbi:MAG: hypothetical protein GXO98_00310, partial [Nitrospirae bacterium]|nr:hypothetical protein [Nitrospirota bacterium]